MATKLNENAIREAAYYIWQNAGCPSGQEAQHWAMAMSSCQVPAAKNALLRPRKVLRAVPVKAVLPPRKALKNNLSLFW